MSYTRQQSGTLFFWFNVYKDNKIADVGCKPTWPQASPIPLSPIPWGQDKFNSSASAPAACNDCSIIIEDLASAAATSRHAVNLSVMPMKAFSNASSPTMDVFYSHCYLTVLTSHTVSVKEHIIRYWFLKPLSYDHFLTRMLYKDVY